MGSKATTTTVSAAGRTLSGKNATRLQTAWTEIGKVLIEAGVIDQSAIEELEESGEANGLFKTIPAEEVSAEKAEEVDAAPIEETPATELEPQPITAAANTFVRDVKLRSWNSELDTTLRFFGMRYERLHAASDEDLLRLGEDSDRDTAKTTLRNDLKDLLVELSNKHPGPSEESGRYGYPNEFYASAEEVSAQEAEKVQAATTLAQDVKRTSWHGRLETILRLFRQEYTRIHLCPDNEMVRLTGSNVSRAEAVTQLQNDVMMLLAELSNDHPGPNEKGTYYDGYFSLSKKDDELIAATAATAELTEETAEEGIVKLAIDCVPTQIQARGTPMAVNRKEFEGVLFRIDEPSESAPSIGPGYPLYITREVAESVVNSCSGLPLDADASLARHANEEITGVIMAARIEGNDFIVKGYLYDWSRGEKVAAIAANKNDLGMSMNASAVGHEAEVGNTKVFWIDSLQLMGANILFSDRATYQQTRVLSAGSSETETEEFDLEESPALEDEAEIAAAQTSIKLDEKTMKRLSQSMTSLNSDLERLVAQLTP